MDYEHVKKQLGYGIQTESKDNAIKALEQLQAKIAELTAEVERLSAAHVKACQANADSQAELAAEQLNNKLLRKALEAVIKVHGYESGIPVEAISTQASTEALDAYVAKRLHDMACDKGLLRIQVEELTRQRDLAVEAIRHCIAAMGSVTDVKKAMDWPQLYNAQMLSLQALDAIKESEAK